MKKYILLAVTAVVMASCSGNGGHTSLPSLSPSGARAGTTAQSVALAPAPAGWANTATQGVAVANAADQGVLASDKTLTVRVGLGLHNVEQLQGAIAAHQIVSGAQFMAQYAPTASEAAAVVAYLQGQGFRNIQTEPNNMLVSADGTAAQAQKAFNTELHAFSLGGRNVYANTKPALVPVSLGSSVTAVLGLNNVITMAVHPHASPTSCFPMSKPPAGAPCLNNFDARGIQKFYDAAGTPEGSPVTVAVMASGDVSPSVADFSLARQKEGLPAIPVTVVKVGFPSPPDPAGVGEWDLDSQSSSGIANNVKTMYFYQTTALTDSDITNEYSKWVTQNVAKLANSSFGGCEFSPYLDGSMRIIDNLMMQAASQGQTMFASSGDNGSACALLPANGAPASGLPMTEYPASSPWIVAVGGTTTTANADLSYMGELAWNAGGGGNSQFENSTRWQQSVQTLGGYLAATNLRGVPDIAMAGDPNSGGYLVYMNTPITFADGGSCGNPNPCGIGGTSESSPLAMGAYARYLASHPALGFAGTALYGLYAQNPNPTSSSNGPPPTQLVQGFHDILTGTNGAYQATPNYDYTTGMGSFDIAKMNALLP